MTVREPAPAKLTLSLRVLGRRPDGYHDLEALVVAVDFGDDLVLSRSDRPGVRISVTGPASAGVPVDGSNLAVRALRLLAGDDAGFEIALEKRIPAGAGLGGGSADAAAALRGGAALLDRPADDAGLTTLAAQLGSDVPFCLRGGVAWMRGRGEVIDPLPDLDPVPVLVVAVPPFAIPTPPVYTAWDGLGGPRSQRSAPPPPALQGLLPDGLVNDLEPAAEALEPRLRPFRETLEGIASAAAVLAGSGSAYFVVTASPEAAGGMAREVERTIPGARAITCQPLGAASASA